MDDDSKAIVLLVLAIVGGVALFALMLIYAVPQYSGPVKIPFK